MSNLNLKALEYTKEIVVAKMSSTELVPTKANGKHVADFAEEIFNKLCDLEDRAYIKKG